MSEMNTDKIAIDVQTSMMAEHGLAERDLEEITPQLQNARTAMVRDLELYERGGPVPEQKDPLDAGFVKLPQELLDEHAAQGTASELGQILAAAAEFQQLVDRLVVIGIGGSYMGARSLFESCCHPYHNELSRARGGPRCMTMPLERDRLP